MVKSAWLCLLLTAAVIIPPETAGAQTPVRPPVPAATNLANPTGVLVGLKDVRSAASLDRLAAKHGLDVERALDNAGAHLLSIENGESAVSVAARLARQPGVAFAEPDYDVAPTVTSDPRITNFWGLRNSGQTIGGQTGVAGIDVRAAGAWSYGRGKDVIVAVIDTGTDSDHSDLAPRLWRNSADCFSDGIDHDGNGYVNDCHGWDFYNNDNTVYDSHQGDTHGTHVAGTIAAAADNGTGGAGVAPEARIMPLKFIGPDGGSISDAIEAIAYAKRHGAKVINASWAGPGYSTALRNAIADSGALFVAAASNNGKDLGLYPTYPAAYELPNLITVAAVDNRGNLASFSNYKGATDIGAPGVNVYSTKPKKGADAVAVAHTPPSGPYLSSFWGFGLETVVGATSRRDLLQAELSRLGATSLSSPITVVDDDESSSGLTGLPDTGSYYTAALTAAGFTDVNVIEVTRDQSGPAAGTIQGRTVIWQTGYAEGSTVASTLTTTDHSQLQTFLQGGGRLLVAGADAIYNSHTTPFVKDYLNVTQLGEGDSRTVLAGSGPLAGFHIDVSGKESPKGSRNPYDDEVVPTRSGAVTTLSYLADLNYDAAYGYLSGTSMAAPHVAAVAALVYGIAPTLNATAAVGILSSTTRPLSSLATNTSTGGMIDAAAATAKAAELSAPAIDGYRFVASDGGIFSFGNSNFHGSLGGLSLNQPIVGMAPTPSNAGYWLVAADGGIFTFGDAKFYGSTGGLALNKPIVAMAATPDGGGYWLAASDGGIFSFGNAGFFGSAGSLPLNRPIVGMAATANGGGYWLVASDGGIFTYGNAGFHGSTGSLALNQPIVAMAATSTGNGYWMVARDGGIFTFGGAPFLGSAGSLSLNRPVVSMTPTVSGKGYWLVGSDGGVFNYGDAGFRGSTGALRLNRDIVAVSR